MSTAIVRCANRFGTKRDASGGPLQGVVDTIGSGMMYGGRAIEDPTMFPNLPVPIVEGLSLASSNAFMAGMDRAIVISASVMAGVAILSYFL